MSTLTERVLFSAEGCVSCKTLKKSLAARGWGFTEFSLDTEEGMDKALEYGVRGLPVVIMRYSDDAEVVLRGVRPIEDYE